MSDEQKIPKTSESGVISVELKPDGGVVEVQINNVVSNYQIPMHIDLRKVALSTCDVIYERANTHLVRHKKKYNCFIKIYSSGKVVVMGCKSEKHALLASRTTARMVQKVMGKSDQIIRIRNYKVSNIMATLKFPFNIHIEKMAAAYPSHTSYEPELFIGLMWDFHDPSIKGVLRIHTTGSVTITGAVSESELVEIVQRIYPVIKQVKM
uniref:TATA box-binding protein-like 1 n=1 Tax=Parastrongyloides trichosuri TaxID=131310 RepID=A0A0N5A1M9_PARTI